MKDKRVIPLLTVTWMLAAAGCRKADEHPANPETIVRVKAVEISPERITDSRQVIGTIQAKVRATLEAKIAGRVLELPARMGQSIQKGDLIAKLDAREVQARLAQAEAGREEAETDLRRFTTLLREQAVTQAEFDAAQARFRVADAGARAAETMLSYAEVRAPFGGVIARKFAETGDLAVPGKPLVEMEEAGPMRFIAEVPESLIAEIRPEAELAIQIEAPGGELKGNVVDISPSADPASRTSRVELDLGNAKVRSGTFGRVLIPGAPRTALFVPARAITARGQLESLFVVKENRAELRLVKTGLPQGPRQGQRQGQGDDREVLSGLSPGEKVIVENTAGLRDGQPIATE